MYKYFSQVKLYNFFPNKKNNASFFKNFSEKMNLNLNTEKNNISTNNPNEIIKISFHSKLQICKDGYVLRFLLPEENMQLGFKTCQYVYLEGKVNNSLGMMKRPYHPISLDTDKGFLDVLVKVYQKNGLEQYGLFSNYLVSLEVIY
jgi:hypothetical protein